MTSRLLVTAAASLAAAGQLPSLKQSPVSLLQLGLENLDVDDNLFGTGAAGHVMEAEVYEDWVTTDSRRFLQGVAAGSAYVAPIGTEPETVAEPESDVVTEKSVETAPTAATWSGANSCPQSWSPYGSFVWCEYTNRCIRSWIERCDAPTAAPAPTNKPTARPTMDPTDEPTRMPTKDPTKFPTSDPTPQPTMVDDHGCDTPRGYVWCEASESCYRPWVDKCQASTEQMKKEEGPDDCFQAGGFEWCAEKSKCLRPWVEDCQVQARAIGGARTSEGCLTSAGFSWCAAKSKCLRIWEEDCSSSDVATLPQWTGSGAFAGSGEADMPVSDAGGFAWEGDEPN